MNKPLVGQGNACKYHEGGIDNEAVDEGEQGAGDFAGAFQIELEHQV